MKEIIIAMLLCITYVGSTIEQYKEVNYNINYQPLTLPKREVIVNINDTLEYTDEEFTMLTKLVQAESNGGSIDHHIAIANVVLNRVKSQKFPNSIKEVISQKGQFSPYNKMTFNKIRPTKKVEKAVKLALKGKKVVGKCLWFNNYKFRNNKNLYTVIQGNYFYL